MRVYETGSSPKRTELAEQVQKLQATIFHLDAAMKAFGYAPDRPKPMRRFANGELIRLIGEAERADITSMTGIACWVIQTKGWPDADPALTRRVMWSVRDAERG